MHGLVNNTLMRKILVFSFTFIGDAVLSTSVIQPLRESFPSAHITFLVGPHAAALLSPEPQIDAVHIYDNRGESIGWKGRLRLIKALRREKFELVINLRDSFTARFIGAKHHWAMGHERGNLHAVTRYLEVLRRHGVEITGAQPRLQLSEAEEREARHFLSKNGVTSESELIGIHPGGNWSYKLWPARKYATLANVLLQSRVQPRSILLFAGPHERRLQMEIAEMMDRAPILVKTSILRHVAALISLCDVYIGNDTGPMHIAAAVRTPVVALFGATNHHRSGPYGRMHTVVQSAMQMGCNPCHPGRHPGGCAAGSCAVLDAITDAQVLDAIANYTSSSTSMPESSKSALSCS